MVYRVFWMLVGSYLTLIVTVAYVQVSASTIKVLRRLSLVTMLVFTPIAAFADPATDKYGSDDTLFGAAYAGLVVWIGLWVAANVLVWSLRRLRDLRNWIVEMAGLFMEAYREHKNEADRST